MNSDCDVAAMKSSRLQWWWHRLRAMSLAEMALHARKKWWQRADARGGRDWTRVRLEGLGAYPKLPPPEQAPEELRAALRCDAEAILQGRWKAYGHLELQVDDPPKWYCDYLAGQDLATTRSAFQLNHRALPAGADIKLIWELSRWYQLTRLAQAAYVLDDARAGRKCVAWLKDWVTHNPPYRGWNWTSALESGMRLIQFAWMDALLTSRAGVPPALEHPQPEVCSVAVLDRRDACPTWANELGALRYEILPVHVWFTWRHKSFGSSANNHLLGELTGLIVATVRWPALAAWGAPLEKLHALWEREVLAQFAEDGGNREQALNYQLFSFEFCWQARAALLAAGRKISLEAEERLRRARRFFWEVQVQREPWDYGDSDSAFVMPCFLSERSIIGEWRAWLERAKTSRTLTYWLGEPPSLDVLGEDGNPPGTMVVGDWLIYPQSGLSLCELGFWFLRWDQSPLGYLKTAAHGHLDALHLSIWLKGVAVVVDPGTGCYYADQGLRAWLASRAAHNGPCPAGEEFPKRLGPFLWAEHHAPPMVAMERSEGYARSRLRSELALPSGWLRRTVARLPESDGWEVADEFLPMDGVAGEFTVRWQFAPGTLVKVLDERRFEVTRADVAVVVRVGEEWSEVRLEEGRSPRPVTSAATREERFAGSVSPAFRKVERAPFLKLVARPGDKPCLFLTTFLASARA